MPSKRLSADYWDGWYAGKAATPLVGEVMNRHLGLPPDLLAGVLPAEAIPEITDELRLRPGAVLVDLACGRAGYGLMIARASGARLTGVDVSAQALGEAREQASRLGVEGASFRVGDLVVTGLPDASADAVLCTDAIQFPDDPPAAYGEIRRVLRAGGSRVVLTCWEPVDRDDERLAGNLMPAVDDLAELRERLKAVMPVGLLRRLAGEFLGLPGGLRLLLGLLGLRALGDLRCGYVRSDNAAPGGEQVPLRQPRVPDIHCPHLGEFGHGLAVRGHRRRGRCARVLPGEAVGAAGDRQAGRQALQVVLERPRQRLVEVVHVE